MTKRSCVPFYRDFYEICCGRFGELIEVKEHPKINITSANADGVWKLIGLELETEIKILQNDRAVFEGNVIKFDASSQADLKHLRISGAVMLKDTLAAGDYVVQVIVSGTVAKRKTAQLFPFEIVK